MSRSERKASLLFLGDPQLDRRIQNFAHVLKRDGFEVTIYYSIPGRSTHAHSKANDTNYVSLTSTRAGGPRMFLDHHLALRKHVSEISRSSVTIACDLYSLRAAALAKRRSLSSIMLYDARELYTGLPAVASKPFSRLLWKKWEADGMQDADMVVVTAPHDANAIFEVHRFLPRPVLVRNVPLRSVVVQPIPLEEFGINGGRTVVYVGGLQRDRGLIQSILALKQVSADVNLLIAGGGALERELRSLVSAEGLQDRVHFAGAVDQSNVLPILISCDTGLSIIEGNSPSYELALPSKVFEYLHAGLPVISTPLRHVLELFDHQPYMEYVKDVTPELIAAAIQSSLGRKETFAQAIRESAMQFSFDSDYEKLRLLIEERLAERA